MRKYASTAEKKTTDKLQLRNPRNLSRLRRTCHWLPLDSDAHTQTRRIVLFVGPADLFTTHGALANPPIEYSHDALIPPFAMRLHLIECIAKLDDYADKIFRISICGSPPYNKSFSFRRQTDQFSSPSQDRLRQQTDTALRHETLYGSQSFTETASFTCSSERVCRTRLALERHSWEHGLRFPRTS